MHRTGLRTPAVSPLEALAATAARENARMREVYGLGRIAAPAPKNGMGPVQAEVLRLLTHEPQSIPSLAAIAGQSPQAVRSALRSLSMKGFADYGPTNSKGQRTAVRGPDWTEGMERVGATHG